MILHLRTFKNDDGFNAAIVDDNKLDVAISTSDHSAAEAIGNLITDWGNRDCVSPEPESFNVEIKET